MAGPMTKAFGCLKELRVKIAHFMGRKDETREMIAKALCHSGVCYCHFSKRFSTGSLRDGRVTKHEANKAVFRWAVETPRSADDTPAGVAL